MDIYEGLVRDSLEKVATDMGDMYYPDRMEVLANSAIEAIEQGEEPSPEEAAALEEALIQEQAMADEQARDISEEEAQLEDASIDQAVDEIIEEEAIKEAALDMMYRGGLAKQAGYHEDGEAMEKAAYFALRNLGY